MSGIISSFFIEPVVRQARRFSTARANPDPARDTASVPPTQSTIPAPIHDKTNSVVNNHPAHQADPCPAAQAASQSSASSGNSGNSGNPRTRARSSSLQLQLPEQSHVSTQCTFHAACSQPPHSLSAATDGTARTLPLTASSHDKSPCSKCHPSSPSTTSTAPTRQPVLSLGQTLFDRFVPLVSTRFSPFASADALQQPLPSHITQSRSSDMNLPRTSSIRSSATSHVPRESRVVDNATPQPAQTSRLDQNDQSQSLQPSLERPSETPAINVPNTSEAASLRRRAFRRTSSARLIEALSSSAPEFRAMSDRARIEAGLESMARKQYDQQIVQREAELRSKIQALMQLDLTMEDRARRMHHIMNEAYLESKHLHLHTSPRHGPRRPLSSSSYNSILSQEVSDADDINLSDPFNLQPSDLVRTWRNGFVDDGTQPLPQTSDLDEGEEDDGHLAPDFGCEHYKRNVKIQCFDCKTWWNCRYCHDAANLGHSLPRHKTEHMLCMYCLTPGPAGQYCGSCGVLAAYYYCEICKLWEDDSTKKIYHCADCGICRLGEGIGKDYVHCKVSHRPRSFSMTESQTCANNSQKCNVCIPIQNQSWHKCIERATDCDCPICGEYMFSSLSPIVSNPCGHYLHKNCYDKYMETNFTCPICKRAAKNMESYWRKLDDEIERQKMPESWRHSTVDIRCNDCNGKSRVNYHWLGNKCIMCDSYNTVELEIHRRSSRDSNDTTQNSAPRSSPPRGNWRNGRTLPQSRVRRYFADDDEEEAESAAEQISSESRLALATAAYDMLAAVSRNLSPIRRYLSTRGEVIPDTLGDVSERELEAMGFWERPRRDDDDNDDNLESTWAARQNEEEDQGDEESDGSESASEFLFEEDSDSDSDGELDISLIGHR